MTISINTLDTYNEQQNAKVSGAVFISANREALKPFIESMTDNGEAFSVTTKAINVAGLTIDLHVLSSASR